MSEITFPGELAAPFDDDPFGVGRAVEDPDPLYRDEVYEAVGDYDPFGSFASRELDYPGDAPDPEG